MPRSRFKLAIPFVGKDVPSRASEFAHPDIIIGLTVLAYRYEGLRRPDFEQDVISLLRASFEKEVGPFPLRKSSILYESWVVQAGGTIKGKEAAAAPAAAGADDSRVATPPPRADGDSRVVVPLWLLKQSNEEQMTKLYQLLRKLPACIHWLLEQVTFPSFMQHQLRKLSASGQELGGDMLFGNRLGFSGTPSDLLPLDLGRCGYEKGSDGKMISVLTDPRTVSVQRTDARWTVKSLLRRVATAEPRLNALIDTGALITGLSNKAVASYLLANGLGRWCEGVVFLDEHDEKTILVRATGRLLKLSQCGIAVERRFCFYDQVHTTGMDIKHTLNARAALTLGKDMVFRDLAQGAFRMRGIGDGQTVTILVIPEVGELMKRQLAKAQSPAAATPAAAEAVTAVTAEKVQGRYREGTGKGAAEAVTAAVEAAAARGGGGNGARDDSARDLVDITAWLVINSMASERVQFDQLCHQNLAHIWRRNAWASLVEQHSRFRVTDGASFGYVLSMLGEAFVSNRLGSVSRAKLEGKVLGLYFGTARGGTGSSELQRALREVYEGATERFEVRTRLPSSPAARPTHSPPPIPLGRCSMSRPRRATRSLSRPSVRCPGSPSPTPTRSAARGSAACSTSRRAARPL